MALRKVSGLREAGCQVTVISPELTGGLYDLQSSGQIHWVEKSYQPGDLRTLGLGPNSLVIAATDRPEINRQAWEEALQLGCLINVADDPEHSNFILPAVVRRGELTWNPRGKAAVEHDTPSDREGACCVTFSSTAIRSWPP